MLCATVRQALDPLCSSSILHAIRTFVLHAVFKGTGYYVRSPYAAHWPGALGAWSPGGNLGAYPTAVWPEGCVTSGPLGAGAQGGSEGGRGSCLSHALRGPAGRGVDECAVRRQSHTGRGSNVVPDWARLLSQRCQRPPLTCLSPPACCLVVLCLRRRDPQAVPSDLCPLMRWGAALSMSWGASCPLGPALHRSAALNRPRPATPKPPPHTYKPPPPSFAFIQGPITPPLSPNFKD